LTINMLTRYPERFAALFCTIPLIDMRRYARLHAGASWIAEYRDPDDAEDWNFLREISAYHNAVGRRHYPATLIATTVSIPATPAKWPSNYRRWGMRPILRARCGRTRLWQGQ
jgi:hypothetical protein